MMKRQTLAILFYLRHDKAKTLSQVPVYMRITVNGRRSEMAIQRTVNPEKWNNEGGFAKGTKKETRDLNEYLDLLRSKVYTAQRDLIEEHKNITAVALRNRVQGIAEEQKTLNEVFVYHNHLMKEKVPGEYSKTTLTRYETTFRHVKEFVRIKYRTDDIFLNQLNHEFITEFDHFLRTKHSCNHNSAIKYIKNLRKVINLAVNNDWLNKDPFKNFSVKLKEVRRDFLTEDELQKLVSHEFNIMRLDQVRDIFIFSCYTGLAYVDVEKLTENNIRKGIDGNLWIYTERTKTKTESNVPLLPEASRIINKYKDNPETINKDRLLPVISNQKVNAYLKEIATVTGIKKTLTFHLARHTFATTVTLLNDVPIETVSKLLGHKGIRTTQIYAKVVEKKVSNDMIKLTDKLSKNRTKKAGHG